MQKSPLKSALLWRLLASLLFVAALLWFGWRAPVRGLLGESYDLSMLYASAGAWADGHNPYLWADASAAMAARGGELNPTAVLLYPPSALAALWPLTWFSWGVAKVLWVLAQVLSCIGLAAGLQRLSGGHLRRGLAGWLFMMALLLWMPVHTGFAVGQVALPVAFLMVWSVVLAEDGKRLAPGILLGLAIALKPQLGLAFLPVLLLRKNVTAGGWAALTAIGLFLIGVWKMMPDQHLWLEHWRQNVDAFTHGGYGDVGLVWARAQMVQASALFAALGWSSAVALGYGVVAFLGCFWLFTRSSKAQAEPLAMMAALSLIVLLAGYHRTYDAVLALVPLAYGLRLVAQNLRSWAGWALVVLLAVFLTPGGALLAWILPTASASGPWWVQFQTLAVMGAVGVCVAGGMKSNA